LFILKKGRKAEGQNKAPRKSSFNFIRATLIVTLALGFSQSSLSAPTDHKDGLWLFGGLGLGLNSVSTSVTNTSVSGSTLSVAEVAKRGFGAQFRSALSYYTSDFVFDLGLDYSYTRFSYSNFDPDPTSSGSSDNAEKVSQKMTIKNAVIELLPRYRFGDEYQLGPILQYHLGGDVGHSELRTESKGSLIYGGLHFDYETPLGEMTLMRFGLQGLMSFNESSRRNIIINATWDVGFALFGQEQKPRQRPAQRQAQPKKVERIVFEDFEEHIPSAVSQTPGQIVVRLPSDKFLFDTAMSHIRSPKTRDYLRDYGKILSQNSQKWDQLKVIGHTDVRGSRKMNMELSTGRARTVFNHLKEGGAPAHKMSYVGKAFDEPADRANNPKAWAKNRRVELVITGVRATPEMLDQVLELNRKYGYAPSNGRR